MQYFQYHLADILTMNLNAVIIHDGNKLKNNLLFVHGGKKLFKYDKPDVQSNCNLKNHISSVHERKKLAHAIFPISSC